MAAPVRRSDEDEGFTLIELMVVVLIIAILLAIAIPTFLGAQNRARDRAVQSNLRNGITAAKTIATDAEGFFLSETDPVTPIDATALEEVEGALTWITGSVATATANGTVGVAVVEATGLNIVLNSKSASGNYFCMSAESDGSVGYGSGTSAGAV